MWRFTYVLLTLLKTQCIIYYSHCVVISAVNGWLWSEFRVLYCWSLSWPSSHQAPRAVLLSQHSSVCADGAKITNPCKNVFNDFTLPFLQGVSIACYAEPCNSRRRQVWTVRPSILRLSNASTMLKRLKLQSGNRQRRIAQPLTPMKVHPEIPKGSPEWRH